MWTLLQYPGFRALFFAHMVSQAGSRIHRIALLSLIYALTQDAIWVSLVLAAQLVASMVAGPLLAPWADTQDRKRVMILSDISRAALVLLIPLIGVKALPLLLMLVFLIEVFTRLFVPAANASIPDLVPQDRLDQANGLMEFAYRFSEVAFLGLAGVLVATVGPIWAFYFDALTYAVSALLLLGLPSLKAQATGQAGYWNRAKEGVRFLWENRTVRVTVGLLFTAACFGSVEGVLAVVLANKVLGVGPGGFAAMETSMALGVVLTTLLAAQTIRRVPRERMFLLALALFGLVEFSIGLFPIFAWVLIGVFLMGACNMLFIIPARSILQSNAPSEIRGRLFAAFAAVMDTAQLIGAFLAGLLEPVLGTPMVFILAGVLVMVAATLVLLRGGIPQSKPSPTAYNG